MKKIVYISILGSSSDKSPNIGPFQSGLFGLIPQSIECVFALSNASSEQISTQIISNFPYLKNKVNTVEIDIFDYEDVLENILKIQNLYLQEDKAVEEKDIKFIVNVTGGTKIMTLGAFMGGVLIGADIQYIKQDPENKEDFEVLNIQMPKIPIYKMHNVQKLILYLLRNETKDKPGLTQANLRKMINQDYIWKKKLNFDLKNQVSAQLMSYHCEILEKNDLLTRTHDEENRRAHILTLTRIGSIIAKFLLPKK